MEYSDVINDEKMSAIKARRGIENMEELYRKLQESEQQNEEEDEGEGQGEGEGENGKAKRNENGNSEQ